nr:hypothetical protein [Lactobacillus delbrueckii]
MSLAILLLVILSGMLAYSYFNVERAVSRSYQKSGLKAAENESKEEVLKGKKPLWGLTPGPWARTTRDGPTPSWF